MGWGVSPVGMGLGLMECSAIRSNACTVAYSKPLDSMHVLKTTGATLNRCIVWCVNDLKQPGKNKYTHRYSRDADCLTKGHTLGKQSASPGTS